MLGCVLITWKWISIRKVHTGKFDSKKAVLIALKPALKVFLMPSSLALDLRNLSREYYDLMDNRSAYVNKLQCELRIVFPQYLKFLSKITTNTTMTLIEKYTSPSAFLAAQKDEIIDCIRLTARFGLIYAYDKYNSIIQATNNTNTFDHAVSSNFKCIRLYINFIRKYDEEISSIISDMY